MAKTKKISATEAGKALKRLLGKAKNAENPFPGVTDATQVLIQSFLVWEWNGSRASSTWARMVEDVTDLNELRVTVVDDYLEYFGGGCPRAEERADRLRATLRGVFHREHSTDLSGPAGGPKKEFREYLDSLEGMTPFVAARTALIAAGSHAVPVDERTLRLLVKSGVVDADATIDSASQTMSRLVTAAQGLTPTWLCKCCPKKSGPPRSWTCPERLPKNQVPKSPNPARPRKSDRQAGRQEV